VEHLEQLARVHRRRNCTADANNPSGEPANDLNDVNL